MSEHSIKNRLTFESPAKAAMFYVDIGWEPLVLPQKEKKPKGGWKQPVLWDKQRIYERFTPTTNVGIALGARSSGLVDIDFDSPEAAQLAELLLGELPSFGRESARRSHRVVYSKIKKTRVTYQLPDDLAERLKLDRSMILEVRGNKHQTMFPPSVHPSGEVVEWDDDPRVIPSWESGELLSRCGLLAALSTISACYPKNAGERDEICMMLSGMLVRCGLQDEEIDSLVVGVAGIAGDEEAEKRAGKASASRARIEAGETVWGLPELCARLGIEALQPKLREWLGLMGGASPDDPRPRILVRAGHQPTEVDQAEAALINADLGVYQRGESLVRVIRLPESTGDGGVRRSSGIPLLVELTPAWLREKFALVAIWQKPGEEGNYPIDPPTPHVSMLLARVGEWNSPVLNGVVSTPTLRPDGTVLQEPGYDRMTGLLFDPGGVAFPPVPENPTYEEALAALEILSRPFREFAFATRADQSVLLSSVLTSLIRRNLPSAPLFAIDAPTAGSGKSLLGETVGLIATGHKPTMMSQGKSPEEDEKRLSSVLMAGDAVLVIDNCDRPLGGDTLCSILTQEFITARVLGRSETKRLPTNVLVMATGNNLEVEGDLGRRTLVCRIDTGAERPDQIEHSFDPRQEVLENRPDLVVAGLTILRAYTVAYRPEMMTPMGSFEEWNIVREALIWLGEPDPTVTRERAIADDPRKSDLAELIDLWNTALGSEAVTLAEIAEKAMQDPYSKVAMLHDALASRTAKGVFNARSVGRYLARHKDRVVGGRALKCVDDPTGVKRYRLVAPESRTFVELPF